MNQRKKEPGRPADGKKKPYRAPTLRRYGDIRSLTQKHGAKGDGGGKPKTKTGAG